MKQTKEIIHDKDYMDMDLGFAYRFLNQHSILTTAHHHNYYEYFLITSGHLTHRVNKLRQTLSRGDLVLIRPDDYHYYELCGNEDFSLINISFRATHFVEACRYLGGDIEQLLSTPIHPPTINILPFNDCHLEENHNALNFFVGSKEELTRRFRYLLLEVLLTFSLHFRMEQEPLYDVWLHSVLGQMSSQENIEEGIPALLRLTGISHGHLCRLMKQQLNTTPQQYITKLRMTYAARLLSNSSYSILEIALKCGYSSLSHFITTFKKAHGVAPHNYRQLHANSANWSVISMTRAI